MSLNTAAVVVCRQSGDELGEASIVECPVSLRALVDSHGGRLHSTSTDSVAFVFSSVHAAVLAAIALLRGPGRGGAAGDVAGWRIGVHVGDIETSPAPTDAAPRAVLVADQISQIAGSGELLVSDLVRQLMSPELSGTLVPAGRLRASEVGERVDTWSVPLPCSQDENGITVVVAEDSVIVRAGIVALLREEGFDVVAEVGDRDALLEAARRYRPALIVTDVRMPPNQSDEGITAAAQLRAERPESAVLVLSQHVEPAAAAMLLTSSPTAVGYLLKERVSHLDEFITACRTVAGGGVVVDALVTERLLGADATVARLTDREREVLDLMAQGRSNAAIAREIHCSAKTLETHIRSIFTKFGLAEDPDDHRRVAAVIRHLHSAS